MAQAAVGRLRTAARCSERCATMTLTGLTRRFRGPAGPRGRGGPRAAGDDDLIGVAADQTFSCPGCARPLAIGQGRCPGCGSLLVAGVLVRTALFLLLVGSVVGMIGGALVAGAAMAPRLAAADAARAVALATSAPVAAPPVVAAPSLAPAAALPDGVAGGLLQVATVNERLARAAADLAAVLAVRNPPAAEVAPLLRKIAAEVRSGEQGARRIATWPAAGAISADVSALYGAAADAAADGLGAPLADDAAYAAAGRRMLGALDSLPAIVAATREVAGRAGIALPDAVTTP